MRRDLLSRNFSLTISTFGEVCSTFYLINKLISLLYSRTISHIRNINYFVYLHYVSLLPDISHFAELTFDEILDYRSSKPTAETMET